MQKGLLLIALMVLLTGCGVSINSNSSNKVVTNGKYPQEAEVQADDFIFKLYSEKESYEEYEETAIYAELTYIGDKDSIEISHAASPFHFPIEEMTRDIKIDYAMNVPEIHTTLVKDVPYREKYRFAGGYNDQDDKETIEFVQSIIDKGFPAGSYVIKGIAQFDVESKSKDNYSNHYDLNLNIGFQVK